MNFIMIYSFYQKKRKLKKVEKLAANLKNIATMIKSYNINIRNLKQALNQGFLLTKGQSHQNQKQSVAKTINRYKYRAKKKCKKLFSKKRCFSKVVNKAVLSKLWTT